MGFSKTEKSEIRERQAPLIQMIGALLSTHGTDVVQRRTDNLPLMPGNRPALDLAAAEEAYTSTGFIHLLREGRAGWPVVCLSLNQGRLAVPQWPITPKFTSPEIEGQGYDALFVELCGREAVLEGLQGDSLVPICIDPSNSTTIPPVEDFAETCILTCRARPERVIAACASVLRPLLI